MQYQIVREQCEIRSVDENYGYIVDLLLVELVGTENEVENDGVNVVRHGEFVGRNLAISH